MPAIKPAAVQTRNGCIGLLATPGTVSRDYTHELIAQFAPGKRVLLKGTTELVIEAEHKLAGLPVNMALLREVLADWLEGKSSRIRWCSVVPTSRYSTKRLGI